MSNLLFSESCCLVGRHNAAGVKSQSAGFVLDDLSWAIASHDRCGQCPFLL